ncbi:MAG: hypothetical protein QOJ93_2326 [Actinomycetota bacterium]|nr:hypothetical protein [Actinomycetota bacterium]
MTAATTSPVDSIPAEIRPRLPMAIPVPSLSATSAAAATIDSSAVRFMASACLGFDRGSERASGSITTMMPRPLWGECLTGRGISESDPQQGPAHVGLKM